MNATAPLDNVPRQLEFTPQKAAQPSPHSADRTGITLTCTVRRDPPAGIRAEWDQVSPAVVEAIRDALHHRRFPILLFGGTGRGKTSAAACLYRSAPRNPMWLGTAQQFIRDVQSFRPDDPYGESVLWGRIADTSFVALDDIGVTSATESGRGILTELLNTRGDRPAIYTSNLSVAELADRLDDRVASRLAAGTIIRVNGPDRRLQGAKVINA